MPLSRTLMESALSVLADRGDAFAPHMHVNISRRELYQFDVVRWIKRLVRSTGVDARRVVLEITETSVAVLPQRMIAISRELSDFG